MPAHVPTDDTWQVARVRLGYWVEEANEEPRRPWVIIVIGSPSGLVLGSEIVLSQPSPAEVLELLQQTIRKPLAGRPRRPIRVACPEPEVVNELMSDLAALGIDLAIEEVPDLFRAVASLETHLSGGVRLPGMLESPGVTPELVGRFFAAAAHFFRESPWRFLTDEQPISVRTPAEHGETRYAIVMGAAGMENGLAVYRSIEQVEAALSADSIEVLARRFDQEALTYGTLQDLAFSEVDALETARWDVAGPTAYPLPLIYTTKGKVRRPSAADLVWYEAALWTIPRFVEKQLVPARRANRGVEAVLTAILGGSAVDVYLRYPPEPEKQRPRRPRRK